jgi:transcriptional regulator of nitric oxide reductase
LINVTLSPLNSAEAVAASEVDVAAVMASLVVAEARASVVDVVRAVEVVVVVMARSVVDEAVLHAAALLPLSTRKTRMPSPAWVHRLRLPS